MPAANPLPNRLLTAPFTVAEALALGVSRQTLRGRRFRAPFPGVRVAACLPDDLKMLCHAASRVLPPEAAFSHGTAAHLRDLPMPRGHTLRPLEASVSRGIVVPQVQGIRTHESIRTSDVVTLRNRLRVTTAERTWCDLASRLTLDDLVILGDAMQGRSRWTTLEKLTSAVQASAGRRGVSRMRATLSLLEPGTESPMETRVRLLIVRAGLPYPEVNRDVFDAHDGSWLARPDFCYPTVKVAIEYDGDHHRTDRYQWRDDIFRKEDLEDRGWRVIVLTADDVFIRPHVTVERIRGILIGRGMQA